RLYCNNMSHDPNKLWTGLNKTAREGLVPRNYADGSLVQRITGVGVSAAELITLDRDSKDTKQVWIPGVEMFQRKVHHQRHRGLFAEFARKEEGLLAEIGLWPKQWATARMFPQTTKGFHIHPPAIPKNSSAADWHR